MAHNALRRVLRSHEGQLSEQTAPELVPRTCECDRAHRSNEENSPEPCGGGVCVGGGGCELRCGVRPTTGGHSCSLESSFVKAESQKAAGSHQRTPPFYWSVSR